MGSLKPGKKIAYERDDKGRIYGRYHGETERWYIGGPSGSDFISSADAKEFWEMFEAAQYSPRLERMLKACLELHKLEKAQP